MDGSYMATEDLKKQLRQETRGLWDDNYKQSSFQDAQFYLPSEAETLALIAAHKQAAAAMGLFRAQGEGYDCDDFTRSLYGFATDFAARNWELEHSICLGMAVGDFGWMEGLHSCNWVYLSDGGLKWIEPQTGALHDVDECVASTLRNLIV
jgi:hypothetical protein